MTEEQLAPEVEEGSTVVNEMEKDLTVESKEVPEVLEKPLGEPLNLVVNNSETNTNIYEPEQKHLVETTSDVISDAQPSTSLEEPHPNQLSQEHTNPVYVESPKSHENSETVESQKQINIPEQLEQDKSSIPKNEIVRVPESTEIPQPPPSNQPDIESTPEVGKNDENPVDNSMVTDAPSQSPIAANPGSQVEFNTAMAKVKEIAAKLGVKPTVESTSPQNHNNSTATQQGVKRSHDDSYSSHGSRDSRDEYRDEYRRDSYNRRERGNRYDDYGRESKRTAYDVDNGGRHRYGLGSEERRSYHGSHYGPGGDSSRSTTHEEFKVPNAVVGLVIGRGGENLKRIEKQTGARIQFSQDQPPDVVERRVTITGTQEDVKSAKAMVQQLVEDAINGNSTSRRDSQGFNRSITIHIPSSKVGVVIGRGGETIRDLQDRSGARINVTPDSAASPQSNDRPVTLIGDESAVQRAKALIDEIVNTGESSLSDRHSKDYRSNSYSGASTYSNDSHGSNYGGGGGHYGPPSGHYGGPPGGKSSQDGITIQVPNDSVGLIIGKGGETVRALQQQSGARIQIEPVHGVPPAERNVQITGSSENIAIAKQLILEKAASGNRERPSRHGDQGRGDYGSGNYQQSSYQQGSYQQGSYQQSGYQQSGYQQTGYQQNNNYQQSGPMQGNTGGQSYQQNPGYLTNSYATPQQQPSYGQNTSSDYGQTNNTSGYLTSGTYGVPNQQQQTNYSQYSQYTNQTQATTYNQYPTQTQYGTYGQPPQYNQISAGQPVGQSSGQPVIQQVGQPSNQQQVGYYQAQQTAVDPSKLGQPTEVKSDSQTVSTVPNYSYQQYGYNYGTTPVATTQFPTAVSGQTQVTTATATQVPGAYPVYNTASTGTAVNQPATSSAPGTGDQTTTQQSSYSGYYGQQYTQDQYNQQQQGYYQQYYQQQQQQQQQPTQTYNYQPTPASNHPTEAPKQ